MRLDYTYRTTSLITKYLTDIEVARQLIELLPQLPSIEANLRRKSLLKSSLFSARIEGDRLELQDVESSGYRQDKEKIEVFNILAALRLIYSNRFPKRVTVRTILRMHKIIMFAFEKIHPFLDGNGRVGRLFVTYILFRGNFGFRGIVSLEEYLEKHRETYYDLLAKTKMDITPFIEVFLEAIVMSAKQVVTDIQGIKEERPEDALLPRRAEILAIIRDHKLTSFDFIRRRFSKVPHSTLHFDLTQLMKKGFIIA